MAASAQFRSVADIESFVHAYFDAWGGTDEERIMSFYSDNATVQIPGALMQGRAAVREQFVRPFITAFPGNRHVVTNWIFGNGVVVVEWSFEADHKGRFEGRPATAARVAVPGCGVYEYDSAKRQITAARIYFDLRTLLRQLLDQHAPHPQPEDPPAAASDAIATPVEHLDLPTVISVAQTVSGEVVLEKLLDTMMRAAIEHARAERASLILLRETVQWLAAEATTRDDQVAVQLCDEPVTDSLLPQTVVRHVLRSRESVILDDADTLNPFSADPYFGQRHARSVFCLPLMNQAKLIGVLYLENNRAAGVFAPARTAVLKLLASQAAIALENTRLYADLQKAHRLETMGTLAGGIAHDFNNILGAILGYGEMALRDMAAEPRLRRDLDAIMTAGERGRALVDRVLAFSRSSAGERVAVHVERVVCESLDLLAARLPRSIKFEVDLAAGRAALLGDPTQVHQVVMNLGTNAAQAMPHGGVLSVSLEVRRFEATRVASVGGIDAGEYLVLRVADTGLGMSPDIVGRIFDPFFTTKDAGSGTGLGLSLVRGIVTQVGGAIDVASTPGEGSTFIVYLPRSGDAGFSDDDVRPALPRGGGQRVLVVDDEEPLVTLAARTLEELGYVPIAFTSSKAALAAFRADPQHFDAVITDERMPGVSGSALIREVRDIRRSIPVVLMSGYLGGGLAHRAREAGADEVLKKPILAQDLAGSLARVLQPGSISLE